MDLIKFLHSNLFLGIAGALIAVACAVVQLVPPNTIAWKIATAVIELGTVLGVTSTTSRAVAESKANSGSTGGQVSEVKAEPVAEVETTVEPVAESKV